MNSLLNSLKQQSLHVLLPLILLTMLVCPVNAAISANFSASASGSTTNLTLDVTVDVADEDVGLAGNYYLGLSYKKNWYFHNGSKWVLYNNGPLPVYASGALVNSTFSVLNNTDVASVIGARVYTGYGLSQNEMIANNRYALVYTVTADSVISGPAPVLLGTSGNFALLAKTAISTVPQSTIIGNVGVSPAATTFLTGFSLTLVGTTSATSTQVIGTLYGADMTPPANSNLTTAVLDMEAAYTDAAGRSLPDYLDLDGGNIGGKTLPPGLYTWGSSVTVPANLAIAGGANDVWIFQISGDLDISANMRTTLADGALAKNIFWQVAGEVIIGAGAHFDGNILSKTAITMQTGANLSGRALAQTQIAMDSAVVTKPAP